MTERVRRLREESINAIPRISAERALLMTSFYQQAGFDSAPVKRARAFKMLMEKKTICINDGELIVGERGPAPKATSTFPELCCHSMQDLEILNSREKIWFRVDDETRRAYSETVIPFWKGNAELQAFARRHRAQARFAHLLQLADVPRLPAALPLARARAVLPRDAGGHDPALLRPRHDGEGPRAAPPRAAAPRLLLPPGLGASAGSMNDEATRYRAAVIGSGFGGLPPQSGSRRAGVRGRDSSKPATSPADAPTSMRSRASRSTPAPR